MGFFNNWGASRATRKINARNASLAKQQERIRKRREEAAVLIEAAKKVKQAKNKLEENKIALAQLQRNLIAKVKAHNRWKLPTLFKNRRLMKAAPVSVAVGTNNVLHKNMNKQSTNLKNAMNQAVGSNAPAANRVPTRMNTASNYKK